MSHSNHVITSIAFQIETQKQCIASATQARHTTCNGRGHCVRAGDTRPAPFNLSSDALRELSSSVSCRHEGYECSYLGLLVML